MSTPDTSSSVFTHRTAAATSSGAPHSTIVARLCRCALNTFVRLSSGADTRTSVVWDCGARSAPRNWSSARVGRVAFALRRQHAFGLRHGDDAARRHHRQGARGSGEAIRRTSSSLSPVVRSPAWMMFDVERRGALPRPGRRIASASAAFSTSSSPLDQIDGVRRSLFDLLADGSPASLSERLRMALTMVRANSALRRSSALRSF